MYTRVNNIMRLDHGPGSSLDEVLLAASLKALTTDQFSAELVVPPAVCKPICVNQGARTALLALMPMLGDVDIALVQRGDRSRGVVIPGPDGLVSVAGGHGWGVPTGGRGGGRGDVPAGSRGGVPTGGQGGGPASAPSKVKDKHAHVVLGDDEVSSDEDDPLQKPLRLSSGVDWSSGSAPVASDVAVATKVVVDKEDADKRAVEEATVKAAADMEVTDKRAAEEAAVKEMAVGVAEDSSAPAMRLPQWQGRKGRRRQLAPPRLPNEPTGVFGNLGLSSPLFLHSAFPSRSKVSF
jgi:hypothetical protein